MAERSRHRIKDKAKIEIKSISHVWLVVDADRKAEDFEII